MRQIAIDRDGKCISKEFWNRDTELTWRCSKGHTFDLRPRFVQRGAWCLQCTVYDKKIASLELMQVWAEKRGGKCLSKFYVNNSTKLEWECKSGHRFKKSRDNVKQQKNWCYECQMIPHRKERLNEIKNIAIKKNGKCLSENYFDTDTKLDFECEHGHQWRATPHIIKFDGSWCPKCYGHERQTIEDMQKVAAKKKGKCLSKEYINSRIPLKWECRKGHKWKASGGSVTYGTWCPHCHLILVKTTDIISQWIRKKKTVK